MLLNSIKSSRILLSPLNGGIEYVSRTIPIIQTLLKHKNEIYICCNKEQEEFYRDYFPELWYIPHSGYPLSIIKNGSSTRSIFTQFWSIKNYMREEGKRVAEWVEKFHPDLIISDQRMGFISKEVKSIIISHQLNPIKSKWTIFQNLWNRNYLSKFDEIWIPDTPEQKYSGDLSKSNHKNKHFLGTCSRFQNDAIDKLIPKTMRYKYLGIVPDTLSSNQQLLNLIVKKLSKSDKDCAIIIPKELNTFDNTYPNITIIPFPNPNLYIELMLKSENIICRPNYTSIMDLLETQNKSILIPDPQVKEQLYLAKIHKDESNWTFKSEDEFLKMSL